jgi:hypothetical protein
VYDAGRWEGGEIFAKSGFAKSGSRADLEPGILWFSEKLVAFPDDTSYYTLCPARPEGRHQANPLSLYVKKVLG